MAWMKDEVAGLEQNGITRVALPRLGDPEVIPLWFGEGDLPTPEPIRAAARRALDAGETFYTHPCGRADLRAAIAAYLERLYGVAVHPDRVAVPGPTMLAITIAAQMALGPGRRGLIVSPHWPNIENVFRVTGARVDFVSQELRDGRWTLDLERLRAALTPDTRAIFVNTPCNPTGWVMGPDDQAALLDLCRERDILLIADEVYHRNVYDADVAPSFLPLAGEEDPLIVVNGFSKAWAMTGWRLGWMVLPRRYAPQMAVLAECFATGATVFAQPGGLAALEDGGAVVAELRERYAANRAMVMEILANHRGIELPEPEGAFYAFPKLPGLRSSLRFAEGLLAEENVGVAPGYTFGVGFEEHFRVCFALSAPRLEEGLRRIALYIDRHGNSL